MAFLIKYKVGKIGTGSRIIENKDEAVTTVEKLRNKGTRKIRVFIQKEISVLDFLNRQTQKETGL